MKRILLFAVIFTLALSTFRQVAVGGEVSIDFFYDNLGSDGSWVELEDYGYCWQPAVASNAHWRPYADGYWAFTDVGWTWVSNEEFGWATYHYGRWARIQDRGWFWVPGREWGPAWVSSQVPPERVAPPNVPRPDVPHSKRPPEKKEIPPSPAPGS